MLGRSRQPDLVSEAKRSIWPYARQLRVDAKMRERVIAAFVAGFAAFQRARRLPRRPMTTTQLLADPVLRRQLHEALRQLEEAQKRVGHARSHRVRNSLIGLGSIAAIAAVLRSTPIRSLFSPPTSPNGQPTSAEIMSESPVT
jgi:hypothetical protein